MNSAHWTKMPKTESCGPIWGPHGFLNESFGRSTAIAPGMTGEIDPVAERGLENTLIIQQALKYAEDMARIYEQERLSRKALEKAKQELEAEIRARKEAEAALIAIRQDIENRVCARTVAPTAAH